ncbi:restriction endonuclease subunit S [Stutzerimonas kunmingensis]|uniref:restriction endonuclease subunit S n=1 Tax=Stutzerimonas kunmingensis TaxID=1211807 RepID=UPI0028AE4AD5|nr:restriction endonuclease subunit S [Stutzerimonas kunmingensis]
MSGSFKKTEVGHIPADWICRPIGEIAYVGRGRVISHREISRALSPIYPVYSSQTSNNGVMGYLDTYDFEGDYVTWTTDGVNAGTVFYRSGKFNCTNVCGTIKPIQQNTLYVALALSQCTGRYVSRNLANPKLMNDVMKQVAIALPPSVDEQYEIANAITKSDELIISLELLIAKKRDIQQAAMQQLLTGQRRLPGFSGEWKVKRLGEIANIKTGSKNNQDKIEDGEYPFYVRSATVERINSYSHDCEAILVPGEGNIGSIFHYVNGKFDVHQRVYAITQFAENVSGKYVHLYMSVHFGSHAMQNSVKATVDSLRLPTFQVFEVLLPPTKEEQAAIAEVLTNMNTELATLEARRDKARQIKQGMMQELLTGRIRLL